MAGSLDARIAHLSGVRKVVRATAEGIAAKARSNLAGHRVTGESSIKVEHGRVDSYVILEDPASLSIEYGRGEYTRKDGARVGAMEGLAVLRRAIR